MGRRDPPRPRETARGGREQDASSWDEAVRSMRRDAELRGRPREEEERRVVEFAEEDLMAATGRGAAAM